MTSDNVKCHHHTILVEPVHFYGESETYISAFKATCQECGAEATDAQQAWTDRGQVAPVEALLGLPVTEGAYRD